MTDSELLEKKWWSMSAEQRMKDDKKITKQDIEALRAWTSKQPHLPILADEQLQVFLSACNYSIELSKKTIDINYTMRSRHPRMWMNRDLDDPILDNIRDKVKFGILPQEVGRPTVLSYKILPMNASNYDIELIFRIGYMIQDLCHLLIGPNSYGFIFIVDMANITLSHILNNTLTTYSTILKYAQEGSCCTIQGIHFMNGGPVLETFLSMLKPFINAEVWKKIKAHEKITGLENYLKPREIPKDYNGEGPTTEEMTDNYYSMLRKYRRWFIYEETLRVLEDKRPEKSYSDGLQGSFRKLDLD